jgi:hypothetical protein
MFYVPVRRQFNSLEITKDQKSAVTSDDSPKKTLRTFWGILSTILVTASPLITTILQKLITGFLSN